MNDFVAVCKIDDIPDPGKASFEVDDRFVVVIHAGGSFYCIDDVCTHDGGPLGEGELCGFTIACPRHGAEFDIRTGEALTMPATEPTLVHDVRVDGDQVFVRVTGE
jgi:3-phenylpropionate/trans-cinnamate dioxygenase ferredoxin subunit